jgi:maltose alpha-D-glucosyltransferase/alpha-amylase
MTTIEQEDLAESFFAAPTLGDDPLWYKDAVIYEVHVRAFRDSNADGVGDFRGLTEKLDYLRDLGVTAIWVLPFYPSPLKDDGYDIADYLGVHPDYGSMRDVRQFIREAHRRGLRVITELVCNHTSDQHPWFQRARRAPRGSPWRDFYVWTDDPDKYREARIIFKDFEASNWSWDPVAEQYYWHRFYSHQPDLNFENPRVREAIMRTMDAWLEMGVDGLRLDAIPYLYEREGTNCENLPETHAFLKQLRAHIDKRFAGRMLLAEANQWPEDSVEYFGDGDECHMAFHFPVMPRLFMSIRMEDRFPIIDILEQTPAIPETAQWALFLRNHDELTLEMVTDEERDYMYRVYARDPQMRINLGIRRRLAPLLGNNRRRIELMNGLLLSLPGTPVIYYGDEIGMGDNVYVGDRNGVRTPMQWSGDRNAGFSGANRQQLYLPVITDPEYHYEAVNVEVQQANPHSLLWWMKRLLDLRRRHKAFSRGSLEFLHPENRKVLVFLRTLEDETILVVANLSRFAQHTELDLSQFEGRVPVEMFGRVEFPPVSGAPYFLTLAPHSFLWFELEGAAETAESGTGGVPTLALDRSLEDLADDDRNGQLAKVLTKALPTRRWFRGKARTIKATTVTDSVVVRGPTSGAILVTLAVDYSEGEGEVYLLPIRALAPGDAAGVLAESPGQVIALLTGPNGRGERGLLVDAAMDPDFMTVLLDAIGERRKYKGRRGELRGAPEKTYKVTRGGNGKLPAMPIRSEQSNSSVIFGDRIILKLYRALEHGTNPDLEIGRFLTQRGFEWVPAVCGALEYAGRDGSRSIAAIAQEFVPNQGDVFTYTLDALGDYLEQVVTEAGPPVVGSLSATGLLTAATEELPPLAHRTVGSYLDLARMLGTRTGQLHAALASETRDPAFAPEPFTEHYQRSVYQSIHTLSRHNLRLLARTLEHLPAGPAHDARAVLADHETVDARLRNLLSHRFGGQRIRIHGDFHAGQVLHTGRDLVIIDFEGEPSRPLSERRLKRSPLRDVAGMVRSFHYAAYGSLLHPNLGPTVREEDAAALEPWVRAWYHWVSAAYLRGYREATEGAAFLPSDGGEWATVLDAMLLHKSFYELGYELNNRPDWVAIPLRGIAQLLES